MNDELITQALLTEFAEMRAEIRTNETTCATALNIAIALIAAVVSLSAFLKDLSPLFLIPTILFVGGMMHLIYVAAMSATGTYCLLLSQKIKNRLGKQAVVFEWESGDIWRIGGHPLGIAFVGSYLTAVPFAVAFFAISWFAFQWWAPSLLIHALEFIIILIYGTLCLRHNSPKTRERMLRIWAEQSAGGDSSDRADAVRGTPQQ